MVDPLERGRGLATLIARLVTVILCAAISTVFVYDRCTREADSFGAAPFLMRHASRTALLPGDTATAAEPIILITATTAASARNPHLPRRDMRFWLS